MSNFLRLSYWLDPSVTSQRAGAAMWLVVALAMALGIAGFALARKKRARLTAILWLMAGLAGF
ncbi:MAG TPA: hypothetical protein PL074_08690, partial [Thermoflexales bacterium]|nr:hypothetical protein [Thermoflexales bacterium]